MLPRFMVARHRGLKTVYYWQVPTHCRITIDGQAWPDGVKRLSDGRDQAMAEASVLNGQLDELRKGGTPGRRDGTMPHLIAQYEASTYFTALRPKTKTSYQYLSGKVLAWSNEKGNPLIKDLTTPKILEFLAKFETRRSLRNHLAGYLGVIMEYARRTGRIAQNPALRLGLKRAKRMKPIRIVTVEDMLAIVGKAREFNLPHVAMGVLLHFDLGQRQGDILRLQKPRDYCDGVFRFEQSKTDQPITIKPFLTETRLALAALPAEQFMIVADKNGLAVAQRAYARDFRIVADACGFKDLWEMELRHSCVIYMERAGLTPAEIATRTGHSLQSVIMILENYRYRDQVVAHQGMVKLEDYRNKHARKV